jgi:hypothetical protein
VKKKLAVNSESLGAGEMQRNLGVGLGRVDFIHCHLFVMYASNFFFSVFFGVRFV